MVQLFYVVDHSFIVILDTQNMQQEKHIERLDFNENKLCFFRYLTFL